MFSRSVYIVIAGLVFLASQDSLVDATTASSTVTPSSSTVTPSSSTVTPSSSTVAPSSSTVTPSSSTVTPSSSTVAPSSSTVTPSSSTVTPSPSSTQSSSVSLPCYCCVTSSPSVTTTSVTTTKVPRKKTCGNISFVWERTWEESEHTNQTVVKKVEGEVQHLLGDGAFNDSSKYKDVKVSDLKLGNNEGKVKVTYNLCLVLKYDTGDIIEDKIKTAHKNSKREIKDFEFKAHGVSFKDWKAKAGECSQCSHGGAGPFVIEGTCVPNTDLYSCTGLKNTDESKDCLKYCDSSAAAIMMSSFIPAMGILLFFSFNI